jgi:hypothetical protein
MKLKTHAYQRKKYSLLGKKILLLLLAFSATIGLAQERNAEQGKKLPGSVILNTGEVREGFILRTSKIKSQKKVRFYETTAAKNYTDYKPDELESYQVADAYYQSLPYEGFTQKSKVFIERTLSGRLSWFTYYLYTKDAKPQEYEITDSSGKKVVIRDEDGESLSGEIILLKENAEQLNMSSVKVIMGFKTVMSKYLSDCAPLSQKIANKESGYSVLNILKITEEYNACFTN